MDIRSGPQGKDAFAPNAMVACDYVPESLPGSSRKFDCAIGDGTVLRVRYGIGNGEVEGAVLASRLLWALGFGADRVYPVSVACRGCSSDPFNERKPVPGMKIFDPAAIERKPEGHEMKTGDKNAGWAWTELALVNESQGGAPRAQRDALTLLAVFMQHTDSKPEQQRLLCLPGGMTDGGLCNKPFLVLHDVGLTFGHGNFSNQNAERQRELLRVGENARLAGCQGVRGSSQQIVHRHTRGSDDQRSRSGLSRRPARPAVRPTVDRSLRGGSGRSTCHRADQCWRCSGIECE